MNVVLKWCMCMLIAVVDLRIVLIIIIIIIIIVILFFSNPFFFLSLLGFEDPSYTLD